MKKQTKSTSDGTPTSARLLPNRPLDRSDDAGALQAALVDQAEQQIKTPELLADPGKAVRPVVVQNGRFLATYVGSKLERDKNKEMLVLLHFSIVLHREHDGFLPRKVKRAWDYLVDSQDKLVQIRKIPAVTLDLYGDIKGHKPLLHLVGAEFEKAIVGIFEEKGKTKKVQVTRFEFRLLVERDENTMDFADWNDGEEFWITMPPTQKDMKGE